MEELSVMVSGGSWWRYEGKRTVYEGVGGGVIRRGGFMRVWWNYGGNSVEGNEVGL